MAIRAFLHHHWPTVTIAVTAAAIGCAALVMLRNMPPHRIVMATGPEGSAYEEDGKRYQAALAKAGGEEQLRPTAGSVETAGLLRDPHSGVGAGLMQGGVARAGNTAGPGCVGAVASGPLTGVHQSGRWRLPAPKTGWGGRRSPLRPLRYVLPSAASGIYGGPRFSRRANALPAAEAIDMPLSREAARLKKTGPPFLHDYFPFW